jgi:hypothetical protein
VHATLLALLLLIGGLISGVHQATTAHIRCAEHGELAHVSTINDSPSRSLDSSWRGLAPVTSSGSDDEHCSLTSPLRNSSIHARPPALTALLASDYSAAFAPLAVMARCAELYRTAPKTSPPA